MSGFIHDGSEVSSQQNCNERFLWADCGIAESDDEEERLDDKEHLGEDEKEDDAGQEHLSKDENEQKKREKVGMKMTIMVESSHKML